MRLKGALLNLSPQFKRLAETQPMHVVELGGERDNSAVLDQLSGEMAAGAVVATSLIVQVRKLASEEVDRLVTKYQAGASLRSLASEYCVHEQTVKRWLQKKGVPIRPVQIMSSIEQKEATRLRASGLSYAHIGRQLGFSEATTRNAVKRIEKMSTESP